MLLMRHSIKRGTMKQYLSAAAAVMMMATASNAAIVEYNLSDEMSFVAREAYGDTEATFSPLEAFTFTVNMRINTDEIEQRAVSFYSGDPDLAVKSLGFTVGRNIFVEDYTMRFAFGQDWSIEDWSLEAIAFGPDGNQFRISTDTFESWAEVTPIGEGDFFDSYAGSNSAWSSEFEAPEAPAPVPLPAAGFLLLGGLAALGVARKTRGRQSLVA